MKYDINLYGRSNFWNAAISTNYLSNLIKALFITKKQVGYFKNASVKYKVIDLQKHMRSVYSNSICVYLYTVSYSNSI